MKRKNRLWLPHNAGIQATFVLCEECGEAYEASLEHVCRRKNSYPQKAYRREKNEVHPDDDLGTGEESQCRH